MTIEQKAKAYDEAIKRAKEVCVLPTDRATIEAIFPELKESEDERIRKDCIKYLNCEYQHCPFNKDKMKIEKCVAWLEKQGENSVCKVKIGETYKCIASPRYTCFRMGDIYHVKDNFVAELINICSGCFVLLEKQGEQKPVIQMKTPEESLGISSDEYNKIVDECIYGDDKPAWSEKDGRTYKSVLYAFEHNYPLNNEQQKFIKSLKERIKGE